jgi:hypothetical protein
MKSKKNQTFNFFYNLFAWIFNTSNGVIMSMNNSKFFAGVIMIMLNIGAKFITIQFSKSTEQYLRNTVSKQLLVFAMAWLGTRDIYAALGLTAVFTILSDYLFNEESALCIVPQKYRVLSKAIDQDNDGEVSESELANAVLILEKAKKDKEKTNQKRALANFNLQIQSPFENNI